MQCCRDYLHFEVFTLYGLVKPFQAQIRRKTPPDFSRTKILSYHYFLTRSKFFLLAMHFGKKSVFLWFPSGALVVCVLLRTDLLIVVVMVVVAFLRLDGPSYIVPLILCPLHGLGRGFEVWRLLWKGMFPIP